MIAFKVEGQPLPKQSFRVRSDGKKLYGYTDKRITVWQDKVGWKARAAMKGNSPMRDDVEVTIEFFRDNKLRVDLDNLSKAVLDAMNGIVYQDDNQVVKLHLSKIYDRKPCVKVQVGEVGECPY